MRPRAGARDPSRRTLVGRWAIRRLVGLPRATRKAMVFAFDLALCWLSVWGAFWLRLGEWELVTPRVLLFGAIALPAWVAVALSTRTYKSIVRFSGRHTLLALMRSCLVLVAVLTAMLLSLRIESMPRTLALLHPLLFFLGLAVFRLWIAQAVADSLEAPRPVSRPRRILIFGAGSTGGELAASVSHDPTLQTVGFLDSNEALRDERLEGKPIWHESDLELVLALEDIDEVFLAIPSLKRSARRAIVERIRQCDSQVRVKNMPSFAQIASGRVAVSDLREVQIEELLGRDEVPPDPRLIGRNITGRRVLVTGAGGSIGSELCRQILGQGPAELILAEQSEFALYLIDNELREMRNREKLDVPLCAELVNVAAAGECDRLFSKYRPETVFHAAAYKHVPLVELNPLAGIRNNVFGTLHACLSAEKFGAGKFILVSTDKAVRPTNVMGTSKRICELIVQARAAEQAVTGYASVRFGNVLASSGSVIPTFREQIARGGPVTITHREATRYFMTIPEASQLVIQAGALAEGGEIFLLDMGQPIRIQDLAHAMIELSGLSVADEANPDGDILVEEIGLRPGEKLREELLIGAASEPTAHPRIIRANEAMMEWRELEPLLGRLGHLADAGDSAATLRLLGRLVPEFRPFRMASAPAQPDARPLEMQPAARRALQNGR